MASSSVSQDDVDNNFEKNSRRSRIRTARARQINPSGGRQDCQDVDESTACLEEAARHISMSTTGESPVELETSPKPVLRASATTSKDSKRVTKTTHHANKGKQQRDRRKLREKRRSTGVVHLASTESTGGSTTGDDDESSDAVQACGETKRNTLHNESISFDVTNNHLMLPQEPLNLQTSSSDRSNGGSGPSSHHHSSRCVTGRDKSPSDLEADDENDHDSLNQSEGSSSHLSMTPSCGRESKSKQEYLQSLQSLDGLTDKQITQVVEENRRLMSLVEEKERRIHMLEFKVQQLMRDTLTISEEQSRLQRENSTLLRALSKLTSERSLHKKNSHTKGDEHS